MTVQSTDAFALFVGDGVTREFPFNFRADDPNWMVGWVDRLPADGFAVINEDQDANAGGVFTFDVAPPVPDDGKPNVTIYRSPDQLQLTDYPAYTRFPARKHELALDKLTMITQGLSYLIILLQGDASLYVRKAGDAMTGQLDTIPPVAPDNATNKAYVDAADQNLQDQIDQKGDQSDLEDLQQNKADKSISVITQDGETLVITDPTLADNVDITARTNVSRGLLKLNDNGKVPTELLQIDGLSLQGFWAAPNGNNPSEENPTADYVIGDYYIMAVDATINLIDPADGTVKPIAITRGDYILFLEPTPTEPALPVGWLGLPSSVGNAINIIYDPSNGVFTSGNVQDALDECGTAALANIQSSTYDPAGGVALLQGAWGLGGIEFADAANLDDLAGLNTQFRRYGVGATGAPNSGEGGLVIHYQRTSETAFQQAYDFGGLSYYRRYGGGVWEPWARLPVYGQDASFGTVSAPTFSSTANLPVNQTSAAFQFQGTGQDTSGSHNMFKWRVDPSGAITWGVATGNGMSFRQGVDGTGPTRIFLDVTGSTIGGKVVEYRDGTDSSASVHHAYNLSARALELDELNNGGAEPSGDNHPWMRMHTSTATADAGVFRWGVGDGSSSNEMLRISKGQVAVKDYGSSQRRVATYPAQPTDIAASEGIGASRYGNTSVLTASATLTINDIAAVPNGAMAQFVTGAVPTATIVKGAGVDSLILMDGTGATGVTSITATQGSVFTVYKRAGNSYFVWGSGLTANA